MAKCPVCNTRKGKRKCGIVNHQFVCSLCCANTRKTELCLDCVFYQAPQKNYDAIPSFSASIMANNHALENYQQAITQAFGLESPQDILAIIELMMDHYYFKETEIKTDNVAWLSGFNAANHVIQNELHDLDGETLINLLGAMRFSLKEKIPI
jgi:hypothetical protein